jgi:cytochrome c5
MKHIIYKNTLTALLLLTMIPFSMNAQWDIPEDMINQEMPVKATYETVKAGKDLYFAKTCASCHGTPGEGNNNAAINASDLGTLDFQNTNTPGAIYYKISEGMGAMPSFKAMMTEEEIWNTVHYIKSFDQKFVIGGEKVQSYVGDISIQKNDEAKEITANIMVKDKDGNEVNPEGAVVSFFIKRVFGELPIGDAEVTEESGSVKFAFPEDIPGDDQGNLTLIAKFKDPDIYGESSKDLIVNWGTQTEYVDITEARTLWGFGHKVPLWLLFTYLLIVGIVWSGIIYVIFKITRIKKAGQ